MRVQHGNARLHLARGRHEFRQALGGQSKLCLATAGPHFLVVAEAITGIDAQHDLPAAE